MLLHKNEYNICIYLSQVSLSVKSVHKGPLQEQMNQILTLLLVDRKWIHTNLSECLCRISLIAPSASCHLR